MRQLLGQRGTVKKQGFVLMEVLVSLTVFSVGIMAVLSAVLSSLNLQKDTALRYRAALVLQERLTDLTSEPFDGLAAYGKSADGVYSWSVTGTPWGVVERARNRARRTRTEGIQPGQMYQVSVVVNWETHRGPRQISATQLLRAGAPAPAPEQP